MTRNITDRLLNCFAKCFKLFQGVSKCSGLFQGFSECHRVFSFVLTCCQVFWIASEFKKTVCFRSIKIPCKHIDRAQRKTDENEVNFSMDIRLNLISRLRLFISL